MKYCYEYPRPCVTVDAVIFRNIEKNPEILLIQRGNDPYKGLWALPGGFIEMDEELEDAAKRELEEETGLSGIALKQFRAYGTVGRDPRARTIGVIFYGFTTEENSIVEGGDDAADARWVPLSEIETLAFDHHEIVEDIVKFVGLQ